jgi:hypothetical protein
MFKHVRRAEPRQALRRTRSELLGAIGLRVSDRYDFISGLIEQSQFWPVGVNDKGEGTLEGKVLQSAASGSIPILDGPY